MVLAPDGSERLALGDPDATMWARSSLKPLQAVAMLRAGLDVDGADCSRWCAPATTASAGTSTSSATLLSLAGLGADDLRNTPDWPLDPDAAWQWRADGHGTEPLTQNCSGKHAGMLATCVAERAGRPRTTSTRRTRCSGRSATTVAELTGVPVERATVDGCGAPLFSTTLRGLARSFAALASGDGPAAARRAGDVGAPVARRGDRTGRHAVHGGRAGPRSRRTVPTASTRPVCPTAARSR